MFERERVQYADLLGYARQLLADVADEEFAEQPHPGMNHPAWLLGHMATAADYVLPMLGAKGVCPDGWGAVFYPGTVPDPTRAAYPSKGELLGAYEAGHAALDAAAAAAAAATPDVAARPNPIDAMRTRFPTLGDLVAYVMTAHEAGHLGQLSVWRRVMGKPGVPT